MGAKSVELPFSYERTRAATPADVYVKVPDQKKKKKAPQRPRDGCRESVARPAAAPLKGTRTELLSKRWTRRTPGARHRGSPGGLYEGSFVLRRHGRDAPWRSRSRCGEHRRMDWL